MKTLSLLLLAGSVHAASIADVLGDFRSIDEGIVAARIAAVTVASDKRAAFIGRLKLIAVSWPEPADPTRSQADKARMALCFNHLSERIKELGYDGIEVKQWPQYLELYEVYVGPLPSVSGAEKKKAEAAAVIAPAQKKKPITATLADGRIIE